MGSPRLPRVPRDSWFLTLYPGSCGFPQASQGSKDSRDSKSSMVLKFSEDPKLSKIFRIPRISKICLGMQSSQGSKVLLFIMLSTIHRSYSFAVFLNSILLKETQENYRLREASETQGMNLETHFISSSVIGCLCCLIIRET